MVNDLGRGRPAIEWFLGGALLGGATTGGIVAVAALLVPAHPLWLTGGLIALVTSLVLLRDTGVVNVPLPQNARQVRPSVIHMHPSVGALTFGFELGTGIRTYLVGAAPYIAVVAALLADWGRPLPAVLAGLGFGLGRGLVPLHRMLHGAGHRWEEWVRRHGKRVLPVASALGTATVATVALFG